MTLGDHRPHRRLTGVIVAALLAIGLGLAPSSAPATLAAEPLRMSADAIYTLDPEDGRVHVAISMTATNLKPNSASVIYYYRDMNVPVQPDATSIRASDRTGSLRVTTDRNESYIEAVVRLRANLYYGQSASFTVRYDLVGGKPRSDSPIRVGAAFATFDAWAWGDVGRSSVEVRTPEGFHGHVDGGPMSITTGSSGQVMRAEPADPFTWYAVITTENIEAYEVTRLSLEGDVEIAVWGWPEDAEWTGTVGTTLQRAMPELRELIGLDWPVAKELTVRERHTPLLEGYAGVFFVDEQRIDVSEDLDPVVIVHEASHAWFNDDLFVDRWIYEGLAEEYAWRVQESVGGETGGVPVAPHSGDAGFVKLSGWTHPLAIRDQATDDREAYGYNAAFWVIHSIVKSVGVERMQAAFTAADADTTAYIGAVAPEKVAVADGWKRLLDLVETPDRATDLPEIEKALRDFVLRANDVPLLDARNDAREQYRKLLASGDGWLPGWYVRKPMGEWKFTDASEAMDAATAVLVLRDRVADAASALDLEPTGALETAYETAEDDLAAATTRGDAELGALAAISDAKAKVEAQPDLVSQVGLLGETPLVPYAAARDAFEAGDLDATIASAGAAAAIITGAAAVGQQRLIIAAAVAIGVLVLLVVVFLLLRRRRRRRRALAAASDPGTDPTFALVPAPALASAAPLDPVSGPDSGAALDAAPTEAYATLAADPVAVPPPAGAAPPDSEGGPARGESPADS